MTLSPVRILIAATLTAGAVPAQTAREIIDRSLAADTQNQKIVGRYVFKEEETTRELDGQGKVKESHSTQREHMFIGGKHYARDLAKDGKPLPPNEAKKEQAKVDKAYAEAARLTPQQIAKREAEEQSERVKNRERLKYVPMAYDFQIVSEEVLDGRPNWVLTAMPTGRYKGKYDNLLRNTKGKLWIDKADYQWTKLDAEVLGDIGFGLFLGRISKGAHLTFQQTRVNNEVWLPKLIDVKGGARFLVKKISIDEQVRYSDYRRFQAESRVVSTGENDQ